MDPWCKRPTNGVAGVVVPTWSTTRTSTTRTATRSTWTTSTRPTTWSTRPTTRATTWTPLQGEGLQDVGSTAPQAVHAAGELQGGDQAEPADEPASGLPDDGPRRGESDEVPRPTIFTAAFGTVYHVRPSCGKLRCASRRLAHAGRCSVVG